MTNWIYQHDPWFDHGLIYLNLYCLLLFERIIGLIVIVQRYVINTFIKYYKSDILNLKKSGVRVEFLMMSRYKTKQRNN